MIGVVGEALIDLVPAACAGEPGLVPQAGGSPFNVAVGAARLGAPVAFVGRLSSDRFGTVLSERLSDEGVALDAVTRCDDPTTLAVVSLDEDGVASYGFYLDGTSAFGLTPADLRIPAAVTWLHASCGAVLLDSGEAGQALVSALGADDVLTSFDPNVRPQFIRDLDTYRRLVEQTVATCDLVKVSDEDLAVLYGGDVDIADVAHRWRDSGPALVVVTRGPDGAIAVGVEGEDSGMEPVAVPGRADLAIADTVGAGDSFSGALLTWLHDHGVTTRDALEALSLDRAVDALTFARDVAAVTVTRVGADPPRRDDLTT